MSVRKIVKIDEEKCDGCGLCVPSCAEGAIKIIDGKARLVSDVYCDGLGACLGECPNNAITLEEREADAFDLEKAKAHIDAHKKKQLDFSGDTKKKLGGCPGSRLRHLTRKNSSLDNESSVQTPSQLANWPVQLALVPPNAPFFSEFPCAPLRRLRPFRLCGIPPYDTSRKNTPRRLPQA